MFVPIPEGSTKHQEQYLRTTIYEAISRAKNYWRRVDQKLSTHYITRKMDGGFRIWRL